MPLLLPDILKKESRKVTFFVHALEFLSIHVVSSWHLKSRGFESVSKSMMVM